jgi:hypothetical protein
MHPLFATAPSACHEASLMEAYSFVCMPTSTSYTLRDRV